MALNKELGVLAEHLSALDAQKLFTQRVREKEAPGYYSIVQQPIDLSVLKAKCKRNEYGCSSEFLQDMQLMQDNS